MIIEDNSIEEGGQIHSDICIIGGGPAAVSIALELKDQKKKIVILTGGTWKETDFNRNLNKGLVADGSSHEPLEQNRRRQFGGGTAAWGGRCIPFEPIDFMKRDWVNDSGWPFDYNEILPFYKKAALLTKIGEFKFNADDNKSIIPGMDSDELISTAMERWSPPVNFARDYKKELSDSTDIHVYINAHTLKICTGTEPDSISYIDAYMNGKRFKVSSSKFILAAGGLENPRLLLSSANPDHPNGIGNQNDNVGRYYMAHLGGVYAEIYFKNTGNIITDYEKDKDGIYFRRRWWITEDAQRKYKLLNTIFFLDNPNERNGHLGPFASGVNIVKALRNAARRRSFNGLTSLLNKHIKNFVRKGLFQAPDLVIKSLKRIPKRRLPSILPSKKNKYWGLYFQAEQTPNRESRITITTEETDSLGLPRLKAGIKINPGDVDSVVKAHNIFISNFRKSGAGSVDYSEEELRDTINNLIKNSFTSGAHHLGTTRMSVSELTGVVDPSSKVFGMKNLYIAGASVFPTGGHANPTLTIIAMSLRLAEYLKDH